VPYKLASGDGEVFSMDLCAEVPALVSTEPALVRNLPDGVNTLIASVQWRKAHHFSDIN